MNTETRSSRFSRDINPSESVGPEEHGALPIEIARRVFAAMQAFDGTLTRVKLAQELTPASEPGRFDSVFETSVVQALRGMPGSITAVGGADLMVQFGTLSSGAQQRHVAEVIAKLGVTEASAEVLRKMVENGLTDMPDMSEEEATAQVWISAYATGMGYRECRPDDDQVAGRLREQVKAVLRSELGSAV